jgi:hypothetical protein
VAVLVDAQAPQTPRGDALRVLDKAAGLLEEKTGETLWGLDVVYGMARGSSVSDLVRRYLLTLGGDLPEGLVVLTNDVTSTSFGGYSFSVVPPAPIDNEYPSPVAGIGGSRVYISVVDFDHPYARCGYDEQGNRISEVSVGGECRNRPGTPCVRKTSGRAEWMCADAVNDLYADHDHFTACTVVHEFLHSFGDQGNFDHYGTQQCIARTGMTAQQAADREQFQRNCGLCPDVYQRFRRRR